MPEGEEMTEPADDANAQGLPEPSVDQPEAPATSPEERPRAFKIIHPKKTRREPAAESRAMFPLNFLAGVLGLMSLAFAWNYDPRHFGGYDAFTVLRYIIDLGEYNTMYSAIALLMFAGSVLCFITSLGSALQFVGVILFALESANAPMIAGPGPFVAVAAALVGTAAMLASPRIRVPARLATLTRHGAGGLSVNVLALSAFALGLLSVLTVWVVVHHQYYWGGYQSTEDYSLLSFLFQLTFSDMSLIIMGGSLLIIGSVVCLLTPLGGILQAAGTCVCFLDIRSRFGDFMFLEYSSEVDVGSGLYIGAAASALSLLSLALVWRVVVPGRFVSGLLVPGAPVPDATPGAAPARDAGAPRSRASRLVAKVPRMARAPAAVAVALAVVVAILAAPSALSLSVIKVHVYNVSLYDVELYVYVDGEVVSFGTASAPNEYIFEYEIRSGIHTVGLDYAYSGLEDPAIDGAVDWSSSVDVDPYMTSSVLVYLSGDLAPDIPGVTLSAAPSSYGYSVTFESVFEHSVDGATWYDSDLDWSYLSLVVAEAYVSGTGWSFHSDELDDAPYDTEYCGVEYLGALGLNCTAYDISGDGDASAGDFMTLSVHEGEFASSSEYIAYVVYEPSDAVIGQVVLSG